VDIEEWQFEFNWRVARNAEAFSIEVKARTSKPRAGLSPPTVTAGNLAAGFLHQ